jgi:hypothetical protein
MGQSAGPFAVFGAAPADRSHTSRDQALHNGLMISPQICQKNTYTTKTTVLRTFDRSNQRNGFGADQRLGARYPRT